MCAYQFSSIDWSDATPWNTNNSSLIGFDFSKILYNRLDNFFLVLEPRICVAQRVGSQVAPWCLLQAHSLLTYSSHNPILQFHSFSLGSNLLVPLPPASLSADAFVSVFSVKSEAVSKHPPALPLCVPALQLPPRRLYWPRVAEVPCPVSPSTCPLSPFLLT